MTDTNNTPAPAEDQPGVLESTAVITKAFATAFYDNAAQSLETVAHLAKLPADPDFIRAASAELDTLSADTTLRGAVAQKVASDAMDDIKAKLGS